MVPCKNYLDRAFYFSFLELLLKLELIDWGLLSTVRQPNSLFCIDGIPLCTSIICFKIDHHFTHLVELSIWEKESSWQYNCNLIIRHYSRVGRALLNLSLILIENNDPTSVHCVQTWPCCHQWLGPLHLSHARCTPSSSRCPRRSRSRRSKQWGGRRLVKLPWDVLPLPGPLSVMSATWRASSSAWRWAQGCTWTVSVSISAKRWLACLTPRYLT